MHQTYVGFTGLLNSISKLVCHVVLRTNYIALLAYVG